MSLAECPSCDGMVRVSSPTRIGQRVTCPSCGDLLEVIDVEPIELDWIYDDDDDDDDDDWGDDD